jgi:hypothetical protein
MPVSELDFFHTKDACGPQCITHDVDICHGEEVDVEHHHNRHGDVFGIRIRSPRT